MDSFNFLFACLIIKTNPFSWSNHIINSSISFIIVISYSHTYSISNILLKIVKNYGEPFFFLRKE